MKSVYSLLATAALLFSMPALATELAEKAESAQKDQDRPDSIKIDPKDPIVGKEVPPCDTKGG